MADVMLEFSGRFQWWGYTVGHSQLLFRRTKGHGIATRVDVLFKDVIDVQLPIAFTGLRVEELEHSQASAIIQARASHELGARRVFRLRGGEKDRDGYVIAAVVAVHEDEGEYFDPSPFDF